jgi:tight adherence protein C
VSPAVALAALAGVAFAGVVAEAGGIVAAGRRRRAGRRGARIAAALGGLGRRVGASLPPGELAARPLGLDAADVMAVKGGAAVVALLAGAPLAAGLPGRLPVLAVIALAPAGFLGPDILIARRAAARGKRMTAELPDLLDLLRVAIEAGLTVGRALGEVGRRHRGPLAREWATTATQLELGVPRDEALDGLVRRCPPPAVATLAAALRRAERHGSPLAETLAAQAAEARAERARRIREHAAKAAPKIQLVVALLLVPSVLLLVAAALAGAFLV